MGLFEKRRCKNFFVFVENYDEKNPKTTEGYSATKQPAADLFKKFSLEPNTIDFVGHATALYFNDDYLSKPTIQLIDRIRLYTDSMGRYGDSPFLYPIYGLGGIPEGFSRLAAIHGGTYMLRTNADEILMENGKVAGIRSGTEKAFAPLVICDPSYVMNIPNRVKKVGQVIRAICLLQHPIPNTNNAHSCQIIIPQKQVNRKSDIYIAAVSAAHAVCPKEYVVAMVSTNVETSTPEAEIQVALQLLGPIKEMFVSVTIQKINNQ
jgi:Rab GDP dissociation inhibitor